MELEIASSVGSEAISAFVSFQEFRLNHKTNNDGTKLNKNLFKKVMSQLNDHCVEKRREQRRRKMSSLEKAAAT